MGPEDDISQSPAKRRKVAARDRDVDEEQDKEEQGPQDEEERNKREKVEEGEGPRREQEDSYSHFGRIFPAEKKAGYEKHKGELYFEVTKGRKLLPGLGAAQQESERTADALRKVFKNDFDNADYQKLLSQLWITSEFLLGSVPNLDGFYSALATLHMRIIDQYGRSTKRLYLGQLLSWCIPPAVLSVIAGIVLIQYNQSVASNISFMFAAAAMSIWLSAASRRTLTLRDVVSPEEYFLAPGQTMIYVATFGTLLAILCLTDIVGITISKFSTQKILNDPLSAILYGAACGLSERVLAQTVKPRIEGIISGARRTADGASATGG